MASPADTALRRTLRLLFVSVEINLVLWLATLGTLVSSREQGLSAKVMVVAGFVFAVLVQHWAYYAVYKRAKEL